MPIILERLWRSQSKFCRSDSESSSRSMLRRVVRGVCGAAASGRLIEERGREIETGPCKDPLTEL